MNDDFPGDWLLVPIAAVAILYFLGFCRCDGPRRCGPQQHRPSPPLFRVVAALPQR